MMDQEDGDLIELIAACRGEDLEPDRREQLLSRLRRDEAFQQAFVDEIRMLGMLKAMTTVDSVERFHRRANQILRDCLREELER